MKTEHITIRLSRELKEQVEEYASKHKWTRNFAICEIIANHFNNYELSGDLR
jgi:predicted DNA-binding protein